MALISPSHISGSFSPCAKITTFNGTRVLLAVAKISSGKNFTAEQLQWLDRIETHLAETLTIEKDDFDSFPVLANAGGWGRANRVFDHQLPQMITVLNEAIAHE